jgi:hypothetical protein
MLAGWWEILDPIAGPGIYRNSPPMAVLLACSLLHLVNAIWLKIMKELEG